MGNLFGTDGMRGVAGEFPLDKKTISIVGRSLVKHLTERLGRLPRLLTGRDTRESGDWIETAFHAGAGAEGGHCESAGVITTPGVAFLTRKYKFDAGIVISASHNPYQDNGIKIFLPSGKKLDEATERHIESDIEGGAFSETKESEVDSGNIARFRIDYLDYLTNEFEGLNLAKYKIVVDCANGASSNLAPELIAHFGANPIEINCLPDGQNINQGCGSLHLEGLQQKVLETKADFGAAFDGDADRSLFVDEKGNIVDGDAVLYVMGLHLRGHGKLKNNTVVATVMSNLGLEVAFEKENIKLLRTPVGDKYVLQELLNTNSDIGGEQSGHIIFPFRSLVGDGMLTMLFLLEAVVENKKTLSEISAGFVRFPQTLLNVKVKKKIPFEEVSTINQAAKAVEAELGAKGRLLLRYSGTENLARVMIEGEDQANIESQANRLAEVISNSLG